MQNFQVEGKWRMKDFFLHDIDEPKTFNFYYNTFRFWSDRICLNNIIRERRISFSEFLLLENTYFHFQEM